MSLKSKEQIKRDLINSEKGITFVKKEYKRNVINEKSIIKINLKKQNEFKKIIKVLLFLLYYIIIYSLFSIFSVECQQRKLQISNSFIILKTKGKGFIRILGNEGLLSKEMPYKIYINDIETKEIKREYYFNSSENDINTFKIIWNIKINRIQYMFYNCENITEIDLSNFDTSQVTDMRYMFDGCSSLISLNLSNFNTSQVIYMNSYLYEFYV